MTTHPKDTLMHQGLRRQLVEQISRKNITDQRVLSAISKIPRHLFVESFLDRAAYEDRALPIASGQTISQPYTVAFQTQLLEINPGEKVLEIGTGSGYQTAVLLEMRASVYSVERVRELHMQAMTNLGELGYRTKLFFGDGSVGLPSYAPFDKIIVTAGAPVLPEDLIIQLRVGGMLVCPVGPENQQTMLRIIKDGPDSVRRESHGAFVFVPLLKGTK